MSYLALLVALVTTCGVLASAVAAVQSVAAARAEARGGRAQVATWVRAGSALLPILIGVVAFVVLLVPASGFGCHCSQHGTHHPHFCVLHPAFALPFVVPALCGIGAWTALVAPRLWRLARELVTAERWARAVRNSELDRVDGLEVHLVDDVGMGAFTIGVLRPVIVVDRALWWRLDLEERRAIVHHERAHAERGDGLTQAALRLAAALTLCPASARLVRAWKRATEIVCDEHAARVIGDGAIVAQALVSVERIRAGRPACREHAGALGVAAGAELERRVMSLLEAPRRSRDSILGNDLAAVAIVVLGVAVLAVAWPGDTFHHAVETVLGHLVP